MSVLLLFLFVGVVRSSPTPLVLWHGMGDSCCNPLSMGGLMHLIEEQIPGIYQHSLKFGDNFIKDTESGYFANMNEQVDEACSMIRNDSQLAGGYNALGISQGGLFFRALAQRCPSPPIKNLVSIGGPQQGVYGMPKCPGDKFKFCERVRELLDFGAYLKWIQYSLVQAQYWQDPLSRQEYLKNSIFLADINNENEVNTTYVTNLGLLKNLVLVKFLNDTIVTPPESEWFQFYFEGQDKLIQPFKESKLWTEDRLGLKAMGDKVQFLAVEGDHLHFKREWFINEIVQKYFA